MVGAKIISLATLVVSVDVPAFLWSGSDALLPAGAAYELERVASGDVGSLMVSGAPAVTLLVVVPEGDVAAAAAAGRAGELAQVVRGSRAAKVFPFVEAPFATPAEVERREAAAAFFSTAHASVAWDDLRLETTEGVVVTLAPDLEAVDRDARRLTAAAADRAASLGAPGAYVVGVAVASSIAQPVRRLDESSDDDDDKTGVRMTPDILAGILVGLMFAFTVWLGMTCIGAIQTPDQFASAGPPSLKEW